MINVDTACALLETLCSDGDQIWLKYKDKPDEFSDFSTTPHELGLNPGFNHLTPANQVQVRFIGGTADGGDKLKTGTLFSMVMDRITFG